MLSMNDMEKLRNDAYIMKDDSHVFGRGKEMKGQEADGDWNFTVLCMDKYI